MRTRVHVQVSAAIVLTLSALNSASAAQSGPATAPAATAPAETKPLTQGDLGHPYVLPNASRARMHECGIEWQRMKMAGEAVDKIWRTFAAECFAAPSDPTTGSPKGP